MPGIVLGQQVVQGRSLHLHGDVAGVGARDECACAVVGGHPPSALVEVDGSALVGPADGAVLAVERGDALGGQDDRAGRARDDVDEVGVVGPGDAAAQGGRSGGRLGVGGRRRPGDRLQQGGGHEGAGGQGQSRQEGDDGEKRSRPGAQDERRVGGQYRSRDLSDQETQRVRPHRQPAVGELVLASGFGAARPRGGPVQAPPAGRVVGRPSSRAQPGARTAQEHAGGDEHPQSEEQRGGDEVHRRGDGALPVGGPPHAHQPCGGGHGDTGCEQPGDGGVGAPDPIARCRGDPDKNDGDAGRKQTQAQGVEQDDLPALGPEQAQKNGARNQCAQPQGAQCHDCPVTGRKDGRDRSDSRGAPVVVRSAAARVGVGGCRVPGAHRQAPTGAAVQLGISGVTAPLCDRTALRVKGLRRGGAQPSR